MAVVVNSSEASPSFSMTPVNPAAEQAVQFTDTSTGLSPIGWLWEFGDGQTAASQSPLHVYAAPGNYTVRLRVTTASGFVETTRLVDVSAADTLRLNAAHSFDVTLWARDQRTGNTGEGKAIPQNDIFGHFAIPELTSNQGNPEVFVKVLDGTAINGRFWVFYGGLTDLEYTLTVKENQTGRVKTYYKDPGSACGGFDTDAFDVTPPPATTATPTPSGTQTVTIDVRAWDFSPGGPVSGPLILQAGTTYRLVFHNVDSASTPSPRHGFSGISDLGLPGSNDISPGKDFVIPSFTPQSYQGGTHPFLCTQNDCGGDPEQHAGMVGNLIIQ